MTQRFAPFIALLFVTCLTACGGGPVQQDPPTPRPEAEQPATPENPVPDQPPPSIGDEGTTAPVGTDGPMSLLQDTLDASGTLPVAMTGVAVAGSGDARQIVTRSAEFDPATGLITMNGTGLSLTNDLSGAFSETAGFAQSDAVGVIGIATDAGQIRATGTANYLGSAIGTVQSGETGQDLFDGQSEVEVSFGTGLVTTTLSDFQAASQITGNSVDPLVDRIIWRDAVITGSGFTGGTIETGGGTADEGLLGNNVDLAGTGQFFGYDAAEDSPLEVGGAIIAEGDLGKVFGMFIGSREQ